MEFAGRNVLVVGLGLQGGGVGLTRFLVARGAHVRVTDLRPAESLTDSLEQLAHLPVRYTLGRHDERDLEGIDLVIANPAVPPDSPFLTLCRERGLPIRNEIDLLVDALPQRAVAITGTNGKSTTTAMIHHVLRAAGIDAHLGGNIGRSLLERAPELAEDAVLVVETSSYQLETFTPRRPWPDVAVWTNLSEDHLSRHQTMGAYAAAKARLLAGQDASGHAVLNGLDPFVRPFGCTVGRAQRSWVHQSPEGVPLRWLVGAGNLTFVPDGGDPVTLLAPEDLQVRGSFQVTNALLALAAAYALGVDPRSGAEALRTFRGLPHRIEELGNHGGRRVVDNGVSTLPETTTSALRALQGAPIVLMCGGRSKQVDLSDLATTARETCRAVLTFGEAALEFAGAFEKAGVEIVRSHPSLEGAVADLREVSRAGDLVLFSPAGSSFDAYRNFQERVASFRTLVERHLGGPL